MMEVGMSHGVGEIVARQLWLDYTPGHDNCMAVFRDGVALGGIIFKNYNYTNIDVHWGGVEGERWITRRLLWSVADYVFNQLGCQRITAGENSADDYLVTLVEKLGFRLEATLYGYYPDGDRLIYVMRRDLCPWLKLGDRYGRRST